MDVGVGCSHPLTSGGNDIVEIEIDFIEKMIEDGVDDETLHSPRRYVALECRFAGYRCDNVRKIFVSPHGTNRWSEKSFAINWLAVHGLKAICVVIRRNDVDNARIGPFYKTYRKETVMYYLTSAIMSEVADLAECSDQSIEKPYCVVSVNDFQGKSVHEPSYAVEKTIELLSEKMKMSCSEYTWDKTIETAISAFQQLCSQELTARDLYVCVCRDIELAPYNLMPNLIEGFLKRGSS